MEEAKKEEKSIEDTFGELDLLARKLEDKETLLCGFPLSLKNRLYTNKQITKNRHTTKMPATVLLRR